MAAASGKVASRATYRGTGKGGFILACQPPARPSRWTPSTSSWSNKQGQIAEHWGMADTIGTVGQLGLLPAPARRLRQFQAEPLLNSPVSAGRA